MKNYQICPKCGKTIDQTFNTKDDHSSWSVPSINRHSNYSSFIIESCPHCKALLYNRYRKIFSVALRTLYSVIIFGIGLGAFFLDRSCCIIYIAAAIVICALIDLTAAQFLFIKVNSSAHVQKYILLDDDHKKWETPAIFTAEIRNSSSDRAVTDNNILAIGNSSIHVIVKKIRRDIGEFTFVIDEKESVMKFISANSSFDLDDGEKIVANVNVIDCCAPAPSDEA